MLLMGAHAQDQFLERHLDPALVESTSCSEYCQTQSYTGSYITGTVPLCEGKSSDCGRDHRGPQSDSFSESGSNCIFGAKQCCCYDKQETCSYVSPSPYDQGEELAVAQEAEKDQCATSWWMGCCKVGKVCDCSKPASAPGQCSWIAHHGCCSLGTPCDCSKPPSGGSACEIIDKVCDTIFEHPAKTKAACVLDAAAAAGVCETVGLGPENPLADVCAFVLGGAVGVACEKLVDTGLQFGADKCKQIAGCEPTTENEPLETSATSLAEIANKYPAPICGIADNVCATLFKTHAHSTTDCDDAQAHAIPACDEATNYSNNAFADACKYAVGGTVGGACATRVREGIPFGVQDCEAAAGCIVPTDQWFREIDETGTHDAGSGKCINHDCAVGWSGSTCTIDGPEPSTVPCQLRVTTSTSGRPTVIEQCAMGSYTVTAEPFDDVPVWKQNDVRCGVSHIIFRSGKNWYLGYGDEHDRPVIGAIYRSTTGDANTHAPWADMGWDHIAVIQSCLGADVDLSCSGWCKDGGHGHIGQIFGTAPACGGSCGDCNGNYCYEATSAMPDYGHGCSSGHKVCCCSRP